MVHNQETVALRIGLPSLAAFEAVARCLNFSRAATEMDVSPTAVSRTVKQLERQLGVRLFNRTTRSVALTELGTQLLVAIAPALEQIRSATSFVSSVAKAPSGTLRLNTSYVAYVTLIESRLPRFLREYPGVTVEISIDNRLADIVRTSFDAGIRFGHSVQRDMVAIPIGAPQRRIVVGAPAYFATRPIPRKPEQLLSHECIRQRLSGGSRSFEWQFRNGRKTIAMDVRGQLLFDEMRSTVSAARLGCGLAYVFEQLIAQELRAGTLRRVLAEYSPPAEKFYLYYPARTLMPGKLRAFVDFMRAKE
ncbi:MAG: LysR family transcriptional regulator [Rhodanobacteraceae bacterium]